MRIIKKIKQNEKKLLTNNARYDIIRLQVKIDFDSTCGILTQDAHGNEMKNLKNEINFQIKKRKLKSIIG